MKHTNSHKLLIALVVVLFKGSLCAMGPCALWSWLTNEQTITDKITLNIEMLIDNNDVLEVKRLLDQGLDPNFRLSSIKCSMLTYAVFKNKPEIVKLLVNCPMTDVNLADEDLDERNEDSYSPRSCSSPLDYALQKEYSECVSVILDCPRTKITGNTLVSTRDLELFKKLLADRRANPNAEITKPYKMRPNDKVVYGKIRYNFPLASFIQSKSGFPSDLSLLALDIKALVAHKDIDLYKVCNKNRYSGNCKDSQDSPILTPLELAWQWYERLHKKLSEVKADTPEERVAYAEAESEFTRTVNIINIIGTRVATQQKSAIAKSVNKWTKCPEDIADIIATFATGVKPLSKPKPRLTWDPQLALFDPTEKEHRWIMGDIDSLKEWEELAE